MRASYDPIDGESNSLLNGSGPSQQQQQPRSSSSVSNRARTILGLMVLVTLVGLVAVLSGSASSADPSDSAVVSSDASFDASSSPSEMATTTLATAVRATSFSEKGDQLSKHKRKSGHRSMSHIKAARNTAKKAAADPMGVCNDPVYSKVTLKTASESSMVALFADLHGEKKFEASDVIPVGDSYVVVYDNLFYLGLIERSMAFHGARNTLVHSSPRREGDSGFEALVHVPERDTFYLVIESEEQRRDPFHKAAVDHPDKKDDKAENRNGEKGMENKREPDEDGVYHAIIEQVDMDFLNGLVVASSTTSASNNTAVKPQHPRAPHRNYKLRERCVTEFAFASGNKGFEGAVHVIHQDEVVLLGLCEGNWCEGGRKGEEAGHGRIVMMVQQAANDTHPCSWRTVGLLALPATAHFKDYSAVAILPAKVDENVAGDAKGAGSALYHVAVTSQESSQVWIGQLRTGAMYDEWSLTDGVVYNFPRDQNCQVQYCNIEGISFVDDNLLVAVSDKMKSGGKQSYRCLAKDQSIHTFVLP